MLEEIKRRLGEYRPARATGEFRARAAVLVPVFEQGGDLHVVLTKRTDRVETHKGEIAFPGGSVEPSDPDLAYTALRESHEEIGLRPGDVGLLGQLDELITISSFHVTPFAGEIDSGLAPYSWLHQELEVAEVLEVPVSHLLDPANFVELPRQRNGEMLLQPAFVVREHVIWGATYRILRNFLDVAVVPTESGQMPATAHDK
jgi:8-oxo-dGTP pyrophosphatase MutT (NUDIX family)